VGLSTAQIKDCNGSPVVGFMAPVFIVADYTVGAVSCSKNCSETGRVPSTNIVFKIIVTIIIIMVVM